jgi:hypothetical protein
MFDAISKLVESGVIGEETQNLSLKRGNQKLKKTEKQ